MDQGDPPSGSGPRAWLSRKDRAAAGSHQSPSTFTQRVDQTRAFYFTISVRSTVGFGDITPRTDTARLVVAAQMVLDLAIIGAVFRLIFNAARSRISSTGAAGGS